jgi:hypothetical protein
VASSVVAFHALECFPQPLSYVGVHNTLLSVVVSMGFAVGFIVFENEDSFQTDLMYEFLLLLPTPATLVWYVSSEISPLPVEPGLRFLVALEEVTSPPSQTFALKPPSWAKLSPHAPHTPRLICPPITRRLHLPIVSLYPLQNVT